MMEKGNSRKGTEKIGLSSFFSLVSSVEVSHLPACLPLTASKKVKLPSFLTPLGGSIGNRKCFSPS